MRNNRIFDCITFFQENFITNIRFEILNKYVDFFLLFVKVFMIIEEKKRKLILN